MKKAQPVKTIKLDKSSPGAFALEAATALTKMLARKLGTAPHVLEEGLALAREALDAGHEALKAGRDREDAYLKVLGPEAYDQFVKLLAVSTLSVGAGTEDLGPARQKLAQSLNEAWDAYEDSPDGGRRGVIIAFAAAGEFIKAADPQSAEIFKRFLMVLMAALGDLGDGDAAALLKKGTGQGHGTDSHSRGYREIQRLAVATMAVLMNAGVGRDEAAKKVTAALTKNGFPATQRAVTKWYDERLPAEVKPRKGRPPKSAPGPQSEDALFHYLIMNRAVLSLRSEKRAKFLLDELAWHTRLWFPAPRKGTT